MADRWQRRKTLVPEIPPVPTDPPPPPDPAAGITREILAIAGLVLVHAVVALFVIATMRGTPGFDETAKNLGILAGGGDLLGVGFYFGNKASGGG